jgi:hypothetical protein
MSDMLNQSFKAPAHKREGLVHAKDISSSHELTIYRQPGYFYTIVIFRINELAMVEPVKLVLQVT